MCLTEKATTQLKCNLEKKQYRSLKRWLREDTRKRFDRYRFPSSKEFSSASHSQNVCFFFLYVTSIPFEHSRVLLEKKQKQFLIKC